MDGWGFSFKCGTLLAAQGLVHIMFCPLCKAQRRPGFSLCSDCGADLVTTKAQADSTKVRLLWSGNNQAKFSQLVGMLKKADVPSYLRSRTSAVSALVPVSFAKIKSHTTRQIFILEADQVRARHIVRSLPHSLDVLQMGKRWKPSWRKQEAIDADRPSHGRS